MSLMEKALRGLTLHEFERLINLCCLEGKRSQGYVDDRNRPGRDIYWTHQIMGINLRFDYYKAMHPAFKLSGDDWAITFTGNRSVQPRGVTEFHDVRIGPIERENNWRNPPTAERFYATRFRRRGSLAQYRHHVSLLRLTL